MCKPTLVFSLSLSQAKQKLQQNLAVDEVFIANQDYGCMTSSSGGDSLMFIWSSKITVKQVRDDSKKKLDNLVTLIKRVGGYLAEITTF